MEKTMAWLFLNSAYLTDLKRSTLPCAPRFKRYGPPAHPVGVMTARPLSLPSRIN